MPNGSDDRAAELTELFKKARTKELNFALSVNSGGGIVLAADPRKSTEALAKQCKADGGAAAKMACGTMSVSGPAVVLTLDGDSLPSALATAVKKDLKDLNLKMKVEFRLPDGSSADTADAPAGADEAKTAAAPASGAAGAASAGGPAAGPDGDEAKVSSGDKELRTEVAGRIRELMGTLDTLKAAGEAKQWEELRGALQAAAAELKTGDVARAEALTRQIARKARQAQEAAAAGDERKTGDAPDAPASFSDSKAPSGDEALRERLTGDFAQLRSLIGTLSSRTGYKISGDIAKLITGFQQALQTSPEKAAQILAVLKKQIAADAAKQTAGARASGPAGATDDEKTDAPSAPASGEEKTGPAPAPSGAAEEKDGAAGAAAP